MITKAVIDKAANDSCVIENSIFNPELIPYYEKGFKDGVDWRINTVWHDASEVPDLHKLIIVEVCGKIWDYGMFSQDDKIHPKARWAYMEDLLPNKED